MKKLFGCVCVCRLFFLLFVFTIACSGLSPSFGNNIRVEGKTRIVNFVGTDTAVIEVTLRWDNSWRDDFNWDAAWVFFKYKKRGLTNPWQHAYLSSSGHVLTPSSGNEGGGYAYMVGANGGKVNGLYVMRNGISEGNASVRLQVKWCLSGTGLTKSDFGDALNGIYVAVHAIEMVYIPYGAYYLGDAHSYKSFAVGDTTGVVIDSENALTLSAKNGMPNVSLAASYPKGYAGFYVMKYETSQEQYVEFLNSLTLEQQKARVMNNNFSTMKRGDYVFSDLHTPSCRNGIVFVEQRQPNTPVVFGNNLNPNNDLFSTDDGQTLACNYMSVEDMLAYCSWSGLRPMSELEYEKACRRFYPQVPDKGEYAWNTNNGINKLTGLGDLNFRGDEREQAVSYLKNVNSGTTNSINGPVRCGLFATSATNQTQAGATYWGVMEMSGNLKELCVSVGNPNYNGASCGTGVYNAAYWNTAVGSYGVRGGGFTSADTLLRTSDRSEAMNYFISITQRDSTVGFRGVYSLSGIKIDGGEIQGDTICPDSEKSILNVLEASCPDFPDMRFQYNWYVKKPGEAKFELIENASGKTLTYDTENTTTSTIVYTFRRTSICAIGIAESNEVTMTILPQPLANSIYIFNAGSSITLNQYWGTNPSAQWYLEGAPSWTYIHNIGTHSLTIAGGLANLEFTLKAQIAQCPSYEYLATIRINNTFVYTGQEDSVTLATGKYKMECWGAQGGCLTYAGGFGGYTSGILNLLNQKTFHIYVGQMGNKNASVFAFNGGGKRARSGKTTGGGASDIRLVNGVWDNFNSLKSRIMVAGAGGGGDGSNGAAAGGLTGNNGTYYQYGNYSLTVAKGGSQTAGGEGGYGYRGYGGFGGFGFGGSAVITSNGSWGSGGGSGYYGGGHGHYNHSIIGSGAGGSSFISGHSGCNAISVTSTASNIIHTGQPVHYSGLYFTNTLMIDGAGYQWTTAKGSYVGMPNLAGTGTMTGNTGNGQVKITPVN